MTVKQWIRRVVPPLRQPFRWTLVVPLIGFLIAFGGFCFWLDWSQRLLFGNPLAFGLTIFTVWFWWMSIAGFSGLSPKRNMVSLFIRLSLVGIVIVILADPRAVRTRDVLSVVYAIDVSDSIGDRSVDRAQEFVARTAAERPEQDEAGLIVFGRNAAVELPPRESFPFENVFNSRIDRDATNLEESLSLAAAMLPEQNRGRIVLVSDGTQTEGNVKPILEELKSRGIAVDVLPIEYDYEEEIWVERLELPRNVKIGENYEAAVVVSSLKGGKGTLVLRENGQTISEQPIEFEAGKSRFVVPIYLREPGYYEYEATVEVEGQTDQIRENNTALNYLFVAGEGRVLIVTDPNGDQRDWQSLASTIREGKRLVDVMTANEFPRDALRLMPYDAVVFTNVANDAFDVIQTEALRDAVFHQGIGFLMVGGENSFGPGGYHRTVVEEILPVSMDITKKKILPKGALAIILHTCEFPEGNTWAKRITKQAIKVLGDQDEAGVIIYGPNREEWVFKLTPAGEYDSMVPKINAAQPGDMPAFGPTMEMGLVELAKSDAATKHMIIITDGDPMPPTPSLISNFIANKISISMIAIYPHGGIDISTMRGVAAATGGRYYFPSDPRQLPSIFIKEAKTLKRSMIQNKTVMPQIGFPSSILKGINSMPPLHGYVLATSKDRAETALTVLTESDGEEELDPILATWKYGIGTTAAFTSDLSTRWGRDWVAWDKYEPFVKQLMTKISRATQQGHLRLWSTRSGTEGIIVVEDFHPEEMFLDVQAEIAGPRDRTESVRLKQIGPRRYQATVPLWGKGRYQVVAAGIAGERTDQAIGGFIVPYSPEYLRFRSNPIALDEIAKQTGGEMLAPDTPAELVWGRRQPKQSTWPIFDLLLIGLACLIPLRCRVRRARRLRG